MLCFDLWRCYVTTLRASLAPHNSLKYQAQQEYDDGEYGNAIAYAHQALAVLRVRTHVGAGVCQYACDSWPSYRAAVCVPESGDEQVA